MTKSTLFTDQWQLEVIYKIFCHFGIFFLGPTFLCSRTFLCPVCEDQIFNFERKNHSSTTPWYIRVYCFQSSWDNLKIGLTCLDSCLNELILHDLIGQVHWGQLSKSQPAFRVAAGAHQPTRPVNPTMLHLPTDNARKGGATCLASPGSYDWPCLAHTMLRQWPEDVAREIQWFHGLFLDGGLALGMDLDSVNLFGSFTWVRDTYW